MAAPPAPLPTSQSGGKDWFEQELTDLRVEGDVEGKAVWISKVSHVSGDVELGQRKVQVHFITIYDCELALEWTGTTSDANTKSVQLPPYHPSQLLHLTPNHQFFWTLLTEPSPEVDDLYSMAKQRIPKILEDVFAKFPAAIFETHGKDLTVSTEPSRANTPGPAAATPAATSAPSPAPEAAPKPVKKEPKAVNTATVTVDSTFKAAADDLFGLLTDEKRIPIWTRAAAQSAAKPDTEFSLFGGGVKGKYVSLTPPKEIVQTWALSSPTWPSDHVATLTTTLDQSEDSTKVTFTLSGVPLGMEGRDQAEFRRGTSNIHGFKSIGYVQLIPYVPSYTPKPKPRVIKKLNAKSHSSTSLVPVIAVTVLILAAAFTVPFFSSS
ncbi:uncharacterized protein EV420DRAFT_1618587 [Desarmillaria tabescens]|uniref:Activator of Hsp90 ATPase AHSA1-like N-terminal domain-containing protein n=1 Tax=Armillaria tabescens TaxID=1929756 RepID=A0AA39T4C0_ARMTA|nr:uncharacterized protein EV420DRAFT_1618587 [Desarmillaria tabescens]KAK0463571.1 hypothetical protein EV420DRAFT_1618587 [Desarmillaria tabescens]